MREGDRQDRARRETEGGAPQEGNSIGQAKGANLFWNQGDSTALRSVLLRNLYRKRCRLMSLIPSTSTTDELLTRLTASHMCLV